ncbi:MAG: hypothetical protein HN353_00765 [Bdellovibrionales bacterium]|jgi:hypothetical protein|nr:hypothetical protein [Bdellovibrionales bacterium]MBT3524690.1 hypothetical protein [Bdellovibrionales bacterium]MBT7668847.1 hypothetical protein [Bdellovibrionales bacterium]MBT7767120.1 hypothetical protein [Bdellovibrionales bacterium]
MSLLVISVNHHLIDYLSKLCDSSCYHPQVDVVAWADISIDTQWGNEYSLILTGVDEVISWMEQETLPPLLSNGLLVVLGDFSLLADAQRRDIENLISGPNDGLSAVWMDLSISDVVNASLLDLLISYQQTKIDGKPLPQISTLEKRVNTALTHSTNELHRVKQIYRKMVPFRYEKFSGVNIYSKYCAGESAGGEIFDIFDHKSDVFIIQASTSSYLTSIAVLSVIEEFKKANTLDDKWADSIVQRISGDESIQQSTTARSLDLLLIRYCKRSLLLTGHHFGRTELWSPNHTKIAANNYLVGPSFTSKARIEYQLERGERLLISSAGIRFNLGDMVNSSHLGDFLLQQLARSPREGLEEIFFQIKKDSSSEFAASDATAIIIEVDRNAITKV